MYITDSFIKIRPVANFEIITNDSKTGATSIWLKYFIALFKLRSYVTVSKIPAERHEIPIKLKLDSFESLISPQNFKNAWIKAFWSPAERSIISSGILIFCLKSTDLGEMALIKSRDDSLIAAIKTLAGRLGSIKSSL